MVAPNKALTAPTAVRAIDGSPRDSRALHAALAGLALTIALDALPVPYLGLGLGALRVVRALSAR